MGLDFRPPARYLPYATALLSRGLPVSLTVEGDRVHPHVGKAIFIDNTVDSTTSTFLMRAEVANPDGSLLPGQYIRAGMTVGEYVDAVVVPEQAVVEGQEGARVFVGRRREQGRGREGQADRPVPRPARPRVGARARPEGDRRGHPARPARAGRRPGRGPARAVHPR